MQTINYIIGFEMISGGYDVISAEKLLEISSMTGDQLVNFNRLDLVLRN